MNPDFRQVKNLGFIHYFTLLTSQALEISQNLKDNQLNSKIINKNQKFKPFSSKSHHEFCL